jgi:hypothetical protein
VEVPELRRMAIMLMLKQGEKNVLRMHGFRSQANLVVNPGLRNVKESLRRVHQLLLLKSALTAGTVRRTLSSV